MNRFQAAIINRMTQLSSRYMPFADAVSADLPLNRLLRLSLFQISVGMATVLLIGTLNRVMILELGVPAWLVAAMVALPFLFAPLRALVGFRSDVHRSAFGWRRVPYIWIGTMLQFGGLAIMPFSLLLLSGDSDAPPLAGHISAALAFLLVGAGLHTTQTAGLALATDLAKPETRPRVVALMYVMLLAGMVFCGIIFSALLADFSALRLIQVVQGAAVVTMIFNVAAIWKQEARRSAPAMDQTRAEGFRKAWSQFAGERDVRRFLVAVGAGTAAFNMQDIILEPYGGDVLGMSVGQTTMLTALLAGGALVAFALAAHRLGKGVDPLRLAAVGVIAGLVGFPAVIFAGPIASARLFQAGVLLIGFGGGLFAITTLTAAMALDSGRLTGLALGAWGAVQATCAGLSIAMGGALRDATAALAAQGTLGPAFTQRAASYSVVYHIEILLLFITLAALGPLVRSARAGFQSSPARIGLAEMPS